MKRMNIGLRTLAAAMMMMFFCLVLSATADAKATIRKVEYEGKGKVDVSFASRVKYKNAKLVVKTGGKKVGSYIIEKDDEDLEFKIKNYKAGKKYKFTIKGVAKIGTSSYGKVSGSVKIPKAVKGIPIEQIEYDGEDREVSFDFDTRVQWNSPTVTIKKDGKNYVTGILEKDSDSIEVAVSKLTRGVKYSYHISGIKKYGAGSYTSISGSFTP